MTFPEPDFPYSVAVNEYGFYCLPDLYQAREVPQILAKGEVYEPNTIKLMRRLCGTGDVIAGGAFVGDFLPALSEALAPDAHLHSFEPNPISRAATQMTIALNNLTQVTLHPCAVGAEAATLPLQIAKSSGSAMGARAKIAETHIEGETIEVPVKTLDDLIGADRPISLLQLDIEGHEPPALEGARNIVTTHAPVIILEAPKPWQQRDYVDTLARLFPDQQYRLCGVMERNAFFRALK